MGMTPEIKKRKDKARLNKALHHNPDFILATLRKVFGPNGGAEGTVRTASKFDFLRKESKHLDTALISYLVGHGILRPGEKNKQSYTLTKKGRNLFLAKDSKDQDSGLAISTQDLQNPQGH
jgi:hypothetical protein